MSNTKNTGGPAFPGNGEQFVDGPHGWQPQGAYGMQGAEGMTLRDYFAAKAMQGMVANGTTIDIDGAYLFEARATTAYVIADAMLKAREQ